MKIYNHDLTVPQHIDSKVVTAVLSQDLVPDVYEPESSWKIRYDECWCIALNILDAKVQILLNLTNKMRIGRSTTPHKTEPNFIDLSAYGAHERGVSREHAELFLKNNQVCISDTGSTNATLLNGKRLIEHVTYTIKPSNIITMGTLDIEYQLLFDPFKIHYNRKAE